MSPAIDQDETIPSARVIALHTCATSVPAALPPLHGVTHCRSLEEAEQQLAETRSDYLLLPINGTIQQTLDQLHIRDPLTATGNRRYFHQCLQAELELNPGQQLALVSIDIDRFSALNHQFGHRVGDRLVQALAQRLQQMLEVRHLSRLGNDEFAFLLSLPQGDESTLQPFIERLLERLLPSYPVDEQEIHLFCSIGIAPLLTQRSDFDTLMRCAHLARMRAKKLRGHSYAVFDTALDHADPQRDDLEPELWRALQKHEFQLLYQPRVCLHSGEIMGAEALIRWQHPTRGSIPPDQFIPVCERSGLIVPIGYWVISQVGTDQQRLQQAGLKGHIGVNLSFRQFQDGYLPDTIERLIHQHHIDTRQLEFELTETALINDEAHVRACMSRIGALGVEFSLDDFGTGYSSFSMLQKLPITTLKIDRSFVSGIGVREDDEEIVRTIISLAHNLNKKVIAEGVEYPHQVEFLLAHGCSLAQGYLLGKPMALDVFCSRLTPPRAHAQL